MFFLHLVESQSNFIPPAKMRRFLKIIETIKLSTTSFWLRRWSNQSLGSTIWYKHTQVLSSYPGLRDFHSSDEGPSVVRSKWFFYTPVYKLPSPHFLSFIKTQILSWNKNLWVWPAFVSLGRVSIIWGFTFK